MNFSCVFLLALALFGAVTQACMGSRGFGYGGVGYSGLCETGYGGCGGGYGAGYGIGYGAGYGGYEGAGYGCRTACGSAAVCDSCQCMKTIVRPSVIENIPYACSRRVQSAACRSACGLYSGAGFGAGIRGAGYMSGGVY